MDTGIDSIKGMVYNKRKIMPLFFHKKNSEKEIYRIWIKKQTKACTV